MVEDLPPDSWPVAGTEEHYRNWLVSVRTDKVVMPDSLQAERTVITHIGAVGILALDEQDRVLMIRQYRHPVARELWEIPAGLRDVAGEALADTARRVRLPAAGRGEVPADRLGAARRGGGGRAGGEAAQRSDDPGGPGRVSRQLGRVFRPPRRGRARGLAALA
jgi:hypothetical protein